MRSIHSWADADVLGPGCPLPIDRPFTAAEARHLGVSSRILGELVKAGALRRMLRGVLVASPVPDSLRLRVAALKLVVPDHCVVVDRLAAWLHGVDALPRSAIYEMPALDVFSTASNRIRRDGVASGARELRPADIEVIDGVRVTTKLRTALDLGRRQWRYDALGALDALLRAGVDQAELLSQVDRFKGQRGVVQLRMLAPLANRLAESLPESALRLHWLEADLPRPEPQVWVYDDDGSPRYRIDIGEPMVRYGVEYNGEEFHPESQRSEDEKRMAWLGEQRGWVMDEFTKADVYARGADPGEKLRAGYDKASRSAALREPAYIDLKRAPCT